jgi:DNA-binding Lrp family transcriptional regulator
LRGHSNSTRWLRDSARLQELRPQTRLVPVRAVLVLKNLLGTVVDENTWRWSMSHGRKYGDRNSYPIYVWNGILEPKHLKRIGPALALFLWLIDRTTKECNGIGDVLGGKPVKAEEIAKSMGVDERTTRRRMDRLERHDYIDRTLTPRGYTVRVMKSCKFPKRPAVVGQECPTTEDSGRTEMSGLVGQECPTSPDKNVRPNKSKQLEKSVEEAEKTAAAWRAIGTDKLGTSRFRARWEFSFAHRNGNPVSDAMERCIVSCQEARIPVPKPFYDAKRKVEKGEAPSQGTAGQLEYLPAMPPLPCKS